MGNPMLEAATEPMLRARLSLQQELAGLERRVRHLAQEDPACRRMMSMPGVGAVVALTYRSAVDDPGRFTSSKKVGPWVGLHGNQNAKQWFKIADHRGSDRRDMAEGCEKGQEPHGRAEASEGKADPSRIGLGHGPFAKPRGQGRKDHRGDKARIDHDLD